MHSDDHGLMNGRYQKVNIGRVGGMCLNSITNELLFTDLTNHSICAIALPRGCFCLTLCCLGFSFDYGTVVDRRMCVDDLKQSLASPNSLTMTENILYILSDGSIDCFHIFFLTA